MKLIELSVFKNSHVLRNIEFKKGLNLIINSNSGSAKSGNSVGKSTPSRLIDYIFMSDGEDIYTDAEFGKVIPDVYNFINENRILVELVFEGQDGKKYKVSRTLVTTAKDSQFFIDGESAERSDYIYLVSKQVFGQTSEKPSLRNLSHKFIRNTNEKMQKTTKFLHTNTKPDVYDQLYLFLFGFVGLDLLKEKGNLNNEIKRRTKHLAAYRNPHRESALIKMKNPLKAEEKMLEDKISSIDFAGSHKSDVKELVSVQGEISDLTIEYSNVRSRLEYLGKSISSLKSHTAKVDGKELTSIYADAGVSINGELKKSYEDLVVFHNKVVANKVDLISQDIEKGKATAKQIDEKIEELHKKESSIFKDIKEPDALKSIGQVYNDLSKVREKIASVNALLAKIEDTKALIEHLGEKKSSVISKIDNNTDALDKNIEEFNRFFGELSKFFYDERYIFDLEFDAEQERCRYDIACVTPNPTGGKKKGELSAFDLAYIEFIKFSKLKRPTFVIHDSIEDVDVNQVFDIFQKANKLDGQYIVALLSDKISDKRFKPLLTHSTVLELSEENKFFKL